MSEPFNLMVAPTGARLSKADHSSLPMTALEIAQTAAECAALGANAIHVHVRGDDGSHSLNPELYRAAHRDISNVTDLGVQISTEAAGLFEVAYQTHALFGSGVRDVSVALREMERDMAAMPSIYQSADAAGISVQHILYSAQDLTRLLRYFEAGTIPVKARRAIFVLGRYSDEQQACPHDLNPFLHAMGHDRLDWMACAFGSREHDCLLAALDHGGDIRIGFENNRHTPNGGLYESNAASVADFVATAGGRGFEPERIN